VAARPDSNTDVGSIARMVAMPRPATPIVGFSSCLSWVHTPACALVLRTRFTSVQVSISPIPRPRPDLASQQFLILLSQDTELLDPLF
jgi:hypothetical protein